jgi:hypothetical protein
MTNIETVEELKDIFLDISSFVQDCIKDNNYPFILMDECDSKLDFPLFQKLLMPIYDGKLSYLSHGRDISNCVFIFVVSKIRDNRPARLSRMLKSVFSREEYHHLWSKDMEAKTRRYFPRQPKGSDFLSRIDKTIIMPSMYDDTGYWYREGSFLPSRDMDTILKIIVFIKKYYGNLIKGPDTPPLLVEKNVFFVLTSLSRRRLGARDLENIFCKSSQPEDGRFKLKNLPPEQLKNKIKLPGLLRREYLKIIP